MWKHVQLFAASHKKVYYSNENYTFKITTRSPKETLSASSLLEICYKIHITQMKLTDNRAFHG